jgi:2',3'-cyclic-nucleotide 2'-phosphodiesterase (5'-nucleotidase family)
VFTAYDLNRELPFGNSISLYKIKGSDLWQGLEEGIRFLPNRAGCFPQVSGKFSSSLSELILLKGYRW